MGKFIGTTGLLYLWNKVKNLLATGLSAKADKATTLAGYGITDAINTSSTAQTKAGNITANKFITSGGSASQVVRGDGSLVDPKLLPQYEAYLEWGGKNFSDSYGPIDAAMVSELGAPRTMFAKAAGIVVEYSTDGGSTWVDYGATNEQKVALFSTGQNFYTGKNSTAGGASINNMLRVSLYTSAASIYTVLNKFVICVATSGSSGCYCTIRCRTQQNYEDNVDTWVTKAEQVPIQGWSGYNVINISGEATYGNVKASQRGEWQFIFGYTGISSTGYSGLAINKIFGFGGVGWTCPSTMAKTGHLYSFDANQNATFPAQVQAASFKKAGGTSSQFLKADGSVDSNTYLTTTSASNTYLPLAGGTMIGYITTSTNMLFKTSLTSEGSGTGHAIGMVAKLNDNTSVGGLGFLFGKSGTTVSLTGIGLAVNPTWWNPAYGLFITENNITWQGNSLLTTNSDYVTRTTTQTISGTKTFSANVTAKSFVKTGGTSSQFLKADGSVDSNTYLTSYTETDPTVPSWAKASTKPSYTASEVGALPDTTSIPTESTVASWGFTKNTGTVTYTEDT